MTTATIDDLLGVTKDRGGVRGKERHSRGELHDILTAGLPDLISRNGDVCNLHRLADELGMTYQGVYKWFKPGRPNRLPVDKVDRLIELSNMQINKGASFRPLTKEALWPFIR